VGVGWDDVRDTVARAKDLSEVRGSEDFAAIATAFKRSKNILRQAAEKGLLKAGEQLDVSESLLTDEAETGVFRAASKLAPVVGELRAQREYKAALEKIATLRPDVDLFFDRVMVMVDDEKLRRNRLALIQFVLESFSSIADFSEIVAG
jgi:glycyl-tRNA synthetase beta chain